jgi:glyoxylase-like metal-dependent hydrolase (beta-lactamase superfamily II)
MPSIDAVGGWEEIGEAVFVRRYTFYDQNIGVVLGDGEALVIDTRTTYRQADELREHLRGLAPAAALIVVNTHAHYDHCFGNARFRPAVIWGHERCVSALLETGDRQKAAVTAELPELADDIAQIEIDPPDRTIRDRESLDVGGRRVELRHFGRGHTDSDIVVAVPGSGVLFAGDLLENGAPPYFGDAFPLDWPDAVQRMLTLVDERTTVVPGHGDPEGRGFVEDSLASFRAVADLARRAHAEGLGAADVLPEAPWDGGPLIREALQRGLAQLRGELDL